MGSKPCWLFNFLYTGKWLHGGRFSARRGRSSGDEQPWILLTHEKKEKKKKKKFNANQADLPNRDMLSHGKGNSILSDNSDRKKSQKPISI